MKEEREAELFRAVTEYLMSSELTAEQHDRMEELAGHFEFEERWSRPEAVVLAWLNLRREERARGGM